MRKQCYHVVYTLKRVCALYFSITQPSSFDRILLRDDHVAILQNMS